MRAKVSRACDGAMFFPVALIFERGNRAAAAEFVTGMHQDLDAVLESKPKKINRKVENLWSPRVDVLKGLAWGWFVVTGILGGTSVALVPAVLGRGVPAALVIALLMAPTTALCASRAIGSQILDRALKHQRIDKRTVPRVSRFLSDSMVLRLALLAWVGWAVVFSL